MRKAVVVIALIVTACSPGATAETTPPPPVDTTPTTVAPPPATTAPTTSTSTTTSTTTTTTTSTTTPPPPSEFFVWMPNGLTQGFAESLEDVDGIEAVTELRTATLHIKSSHKADGTPVDEPRAGYVIPVHAAIVAPEGLEHIVGVADLAPDELVLGEDSAALRRLEVGDTITFERSTMTVGAIVPESLMSGYEMIATTPEPFVERRMETRAVHVLYDWSRYRLFLEARARVDEDTTFRVSERSTSADRGGLAVRSQAFIKQVFGEFAYRPTTGRSFVIDPDWINANIVDVRIPLLGRTRCHKLYTEILTDIMQDLVDNGLSDVIDRSAFAGCWNGRYIASSYRLSRHAFGAAADINIFNTPDEGPGSPVHPELLWRMEEAGITSGHKWAKTDAGHFEYFGTFDE
ncbi:M15 family metallopeptidase [Actinomycetota bacterium]